MIRIYYFSLFFLITLLLASPFLSLTGLDTIGFDSGGTSGKIGSNPNQNLEGSFNDISQEVITVPSGGNGGGSSVSAKQNITVIPSEITENLAINTNLEREITVTNNGYRTENLSISSTGLDNMIILGKNYLYINPGETKTFKIILVALSQTGIFTGKIKIGDNEVLITLNIRTKLLLFDSKIEVLNFMSKVIKGSKLKTKIDLIPLGDKERMDVKLNYVIKDYEGNTYLTKSETVLIENETKFEREFNTGSLPEGKYIIGLEMIYPNGVATSSDSFEVTSKFSLGAIIYYLIVAILINSIIIVIVLLNSWSREKEQSVYG